MTAREIARDFISKMNPCRWNGRGYKPDTFNDKDQIRYHVDGHPEIDVDVLVYVILMFGLLMQLKNLLNIYLTK